MNSSTMSIAVASADLQGIDGQVSEHFGRCPAYTLVEVVEGVVHDSRIESNPFVEGHAPGQIPEYIADLGANVILTGGIGGRAIQFFEQRGVQVAAGFNGPVKNAVEAFLRGELRESDPCSGGHGDCHD
ncbi:NifB/NifX family molybdenum-iron cluster-binding protein [bacterium]|nr:NifB/NifX family molybdenum-iron cluster-binding protein [bacterium]